VWQSAELLGLIVDGGQPADRAMHEYFRSHRKMGSNDRALVARLVYAVLHRGPSLLALLASAPPPQDGESSGATRPDGPPWRRLVLAHLALRGEWTPAHLERLGWGAEASALAATARSLDASAASPGVRADLPGWIAVPLAGELGVEGLLALGEALRQQAPVDMRVNPLKTSRDAARDHLALAGFPSQPTPYSPVGLRCHVRGPLAQTQAFQEGWIEVQDEGSQLVAPLLAPRPGERIVDFCAGGGGKTLHLATLMENQGTVQACDVSAQRLGNLRPRQRRAGLDNIRTQVIAGEDDPVLERLRGEMDGVLVDAPCSGTGTLRRNPDIAWRPADLGALAAAQTRILAAAARLVRPGGRLVYATCSLLRAENQDVARAFLAAHPDFRARPALPVLREQGIALPPDAADGPFLRLLPHRHGCDGFFGALLERAA
jgi:16S rRNA (cytosine967-C5)-methyltransferase